MRRLNAFVQEEQPWQLAKDEAQAERLDAALYALAEGLRVVSLLLVPFMPEATDKLLTALGQDDRSLEAARFGSVGGGARCASSSRSSRASKRPPPPERWPGSPRRSRSPRPALAAAAG